MPLKGPDFIVDLAPIDRALHAERVARHEWLGLVHDEIGTFERGSSGKEAFLSNRA